MKCYKLLFSKKGQLKNYGSFILAAIIIINFILMILCFISGAKKIKYFIETVMRQKQGNINNKRKKTSKSKKVLIQIKKEKQKKILNNEGLSNSSNLKLGDIFERKKEPPKKKYKKGKKRKLFLKTDKNSKYDKPLSSKFIFKKTNLNIFSISPNKSEIKFDINMANNISKKPFKKNQKNKTLNKYSNTSNNKNIKNNIINNDYFLNDLELNYLDYEKAKILDKRGFFKYYWSILQLNHLILFAFMPINDYNLRSIKISLLLISFSLYFSNNCLFFSDNSMHKIYLNFGKYSFINQLPQMVYSILISATINSILKMISLSGKNILSIKKIKNHSFILKRANSIEKCEKIKIILFYVISFIFLLFFWYFISCFCAVYVNTQKILISDTLISFAISMIYPFGIYLLFSSLRLIALKPSKEKESFKIFLYKIVLLFT